MRKFVVLILAIGTLLCGVGYWLNALGHLNSGRIDLYLLLFLSILTIVVHWINLGAVKESGQSSVIMMVLSMVIKLLLGGAFLLFMVYQYPGRAIEIVVEFFTVYVLFTSLDIYMVRNTIPS